MTPCTETRRILSAAGFLLACLCFLADVASAQYVPPANNRVDLNFNYDWRFIKSDVAGASAVGFDDSSWTPVSLPHTWNDGDRFREWINTVAELANQTNYPDAAYGQAPPADPLLPNGTYYGIGWYRKHFTIDPAYAGRKVILEFSGISRCAHFYVNGQDLAQQVVTLPGSSSAPSETIEVGYHENGIGPCGLDITNYLNPTGQDNVIAVWVTNDFNYVTEEFGTVLPYGQPFNLNFGGLQRDATMHICDPLYQTLPLFRNLGTQGTYVYPANIDTLHQTANLTVQAEVKNDYSVAKTATLEAVIVDANGNQVGSTFSAPAAQTITPGQLSIFTATTGMTGVHFWDTNYPYMYQVYTILSVGGQVVDVYKTPLGVRKYKFGSTIGLELNGHPIYLNGYAPRTTMEWADVGIPPDWMVEYDFAMIKASGGNFVRPMHSAPRRIQVDTADKYGVVMVCPATATENDETNPLYWTQKLYDMRDVCIYFRNNPSVYFWEGNNGDLSATHMQDMLNITSTWDFGNVVTGADADPNDDGRLIGTRSAGTGAAAYGLQQYSSPIESNMTDATQPIWDAEYARGECPRHVWDNYTPMLNPAWDGKNADPTPAEDTIGDTAHKYLIGGYFYISNPFYQLTAGEGDASTVPAGGSGLNYDAGAGINDYLAVIPDRDSSGNPTGTVSNGYYRLMNSEELMIENTAKYYGRYENSVFMLPSATAAQSGVTIGAAKIIWSDSVTDGRMVSVDVARVSGAVDGVRLPKETYYGMRVAQNSQPDIYIAGHWNYPAGTVKTVYVVSNTSQVDLKTFDTSGNLIKDYGFGSNDFFPAGILSPASDQVNKYVFAFDNVAWQPGSIQALGYNDGSTAPVVQTALGDPLHPSLKTVGAPASIKITPTTGPQGWLADGSDIAMFDVEVVDANGERCPTYEDTVTFSCSDPTTGTFLGGYDTGIRYTTNVSHLTSGYNLNIEAGINRVFVRAPRTAGTFTLHVTGNGLTAGGISLPSQPFTVVTNGLTATLPQKYTVALGTEPTPVAEGIAPPPPPNSPQPAPATNVQGLHYSGTNQDLAVLIENVHPGQQAYVDSSTITLPANLPGYLIGGEFIQPFESDANGAQATDQYQFNTSRYSYLYLVIDSANGMPANDGNAGYQWTKLADTVTINNRPMNVYKSILEAPYTPVFLASNNYNNATPPGFDPKSNMYLVFVVSAEQQLQNPTDTIVASTTQSASTPAADAIDGNVTTRWNASSGTMPQTLTLTLANPASIGGYDINWQNNATRYYQYEIDVSQDGNTWLKSLDMTGNVNPGEAEYRVPAPLVQNSMGISFIRITVNNASAGGWAAINELKVNGIFDSASTAPVPVITSPLTESGNAGYPFSYQIAATNAPTGFTAQGLPSGLTVNAITGAISGTTLQGGLLPITVSAINSGGTGSAVLDVSMAAPPPVPVITSALTYTTQAGVAIASAAAYTITATNMNYTPSSYSATLPANLGLAYSSSTGKITGTPKYPGTYTIPIDATNPGGAGTAANLQFVVTPNGAPPSITSPGTAAATTAIAFTYPITGINNPTLFSASNLPPGLSVNTGTGVISGTPTTAGTYSSIVLTASNAGGEATEDLTITVSRNPNAPTITSPLTAGGNVAVKFSYQVVATNTPTAYSAIPLPPGLSISATGLISGSPTATGTTDTVLKATNASGSDTETLIITIGPAVTPPTLTSPVNAVGGVNLPFTFQITASNTPTMFAAAPLPLGLNINQSSGLIYGTPNTAGTTAVTLGASNPGGNSLPATLTVVISPAGSDINLALNKAVVTSQPPVNGNLGGKAVDGSTATRWESPYSDPQSIYVNLGAPCTIHAVNLDWENACGKNYQILGSNDLSTWTLLTPAITGNTTSGWLYYPNMTGAWQYIEVSGTVRANPLYGYSLWEFQVMGQPNTLSAPAGLTAGPGTNAGQILLKWTALSGAQSYTIERSTSSISGFAPVATENVPAVTYTDADQSLRAGQTYYYQIQAVTSQGTTPYSAPVSGTPDVPAGIAGWRYQYFGSAGLSPTMANGAADGADPTQDGISNLLKYALALDPTVNYYSSDSNLLPAVKTQSFGGVPYLALTFTGAATDVTYNVQASGSPGGPWLTLATYSGSPALGTFTIQDSQPVSASSARFMRLQVTGP